MCAGVSAHPSSDSNGPNTSQIFVNGTGTVAVSSLDWICERDTGEEEAAAEPPPVYVDRTAQFIPPFPVLPDTAAAADVPMAAVNRLPVSAASMPLVCHLLSTFPDKHPFAQSQDGDHANRLSVLVVGTDDGSIRLYAGLVLRQ